MTANFVSFCACTNFTAPSELLSGKRDGLQLSPCLRRNQISSPRTSLFIRRTREKLWWNFSLVCCASSPNDGLGSEPSGASLSGKTGRTAGVVDDGVLQYPLVNREQAVYEVLRNFRKAVLVRAAGNDRARPTSSFLPQLYGIGKSVFGEDFHHFLYTSKDYLSQRIGHMPGVPPGPNVKERSVDALISGTLYAFVDIRGFYSTGIEFEPELIKRICKEAVSGFPNSSTLLDEVYKSFDKQELWIEKLLQVTNKRYLFLFIDEIGDLTSSKFKRFVDLYSEDEKETNVFRSFFRILCRVVNYPRIICVVAGKNRVCTESNM